MILFAGCKNGQAVRRMTCGLNCCWRLHMQWVNASSLHEFVVSPFFVCSCIVSGHCPQTEAPRSACGGPSLTETHHALLVHHGTVNAWCRIISIITLRSDRFRLQRDKSKSVHCSPISGMGRHPQGRDVTRLSLAEGTYLPQTARITLTVYPEGLGQPRIRSSSAYESAKV